MRIANDAKADLLLSIHCDSFTKSSAVGSSSFVMGLGKSESSLRVASKTPPFTRKPTPKI